MTFVGTVTDSIKAVKAPIYAPTICRLLFAFKN